MSHTITEKCTGCAICSLKCPSDAIYGVKKERFYVNSKLCIDCHVCGWWCPQAAILDNEDNVVQRKKPKEMPKGSVYSEDCNGCKLCIDICPVHCIELISDGYDDNFHNYVAKVNQKECVGCGLCEQVCIKGAITVSKGDCVVVSAK